MMPTTMLRGGPVLVWLALVAACRSVTTSYDYPEDLDSPDYVKRSMAARQFAAMQDADRLPGAFSLLLDDEAHIRAVAHLAIRSMMPGNEDFGYRPYLPEEDRHLIVARWEAWWRKTGAVEASRG